MGSKLLHLTDFHIAESESEYELLRKGFYREYIDGVVRCLDLSNGVDKIFITGDFVDRGKFENYQHVEKLIDYLVEAVGIRKNDVFLVAGNHDVNRQFDETGNASEARQHVNGLFAKYGGREPIHQVERGICQNAGDNLDVILLDSTLGSNGRDHPGTLEIQEADSLYQWIDRLDKSGDLVICSHHPLENSPALIGPADERAPDWAQRHVWQSAGPFLWRMQNNLQWTGNIIWLAGDIHRSAFRREGVHTYVVTGRFGGDMRHHTEQRRQARLINVDGNGCTSKLAEYSPIGHNAHAYMGKWTIQIDNLVSSQLSSSTEKPESESKYAEPIEGGQEVMLRDERRRHGIERVRGSESRFEVVDSELEDGIVQTIEHNDLYVFGRFLTSIDTASLAWVPISDLVNGMQDSFPILVDGMAGWVLNKLGDGVDPERVVLLGVDSWGAIMASQISVKTNVRNFCIASRAHGKYHESHETISDRLISLLKDVDVVLVVVDVIASGKSFSFVVEEIERRREGENDELRWYGLALLCDPTQHRGGTLDKFDSIGIGCGKLKMPLLSDSELPDHNILCPVIDWVEAGNRGAFEDIHDNCEDDGCP